MEPSRIAFSLEHGAAGGRGQPASCEPLCAAAWEAGIRTYLSWDSLGRGEADRALGKLVENHPRAEICLMSLITQDAGAGGMLTAEGVRGAVDATLERLGVREVDVLFLGNPGREGFRDEALWGALAEVKRDGRAKAIGLAPGPGNGYALDFLLALERFGEVLDWGLIVLNPLEPWPGELVLEAAAKAGVRLAARESAPVPGPAMGREMAERGRKMEALAEVASRHGLELETLLAAWTLGQGGVAIMVPRLAVREGDTVEEQIGRFGEVEGVEALEPLSGDVLAEVAAVGGSRGKVALKGGTQQYQGKEQAQQWPLDEALAGVAERNGIVLDRDYYCASDPRDLRDFGMALGGVPQAIDRRLFMQLQVFTGVRNREAVAEAFRSQGLEAVVYGDLNDPRGVGVLLWDEDPLGLSARADRAYGMEEFAVAELRPEFTMLGRCYGFGREDDVEYWLTRRAIEVATYPTRPWAVWYPLRRTGSFYRLPKEEQSDMLREHGIIGHNFGSAGYAADIRLECFGMDARDNEFVLGLHSERLDWLSKLVKEMRSTRQTGEFMENLGPFFIGHTLYQWQP